jgi:hypothetical protein
MFTNLAEICLPCMVQNVDYCVTEEIVGIF